MRESGLNALAIATADATRAAGGALAEALRVAPRQPIVIGLSGELGAGKTTFVSGVLNALGVPGPIRSPTYTLVEPYEASGRAIFHLDLYRLTDAREVDALGVRDLLDDAAVMLIEWPEKGGDRLPSFDVHVALRYAPAGNGRTMELRAHTDAGRDLVRRIVRVMSK